MKRAHGTETSASAALPRPVLVSPSAMLPLLLLAVLGLSQGAIVKRQVNCVDSWALNNNPCQRGSGTVYYSHPTDPQKYVQCDLYGRAYIVRCPNGMLFNRATTSCQQVQVNPTMPPTVNVQTPCNSLALQTGDIFFAYPSDRSRFYECTANGAQLLTCPTGLLWDQARKSCVYQYSTGTGSTVGTGIIQATPPPSLGVGLTNPCSVQSIATGRRYFSHPDAHQFIQCDDVGNAFVVSCPSGLIWNNYLETCNSPFQNTIITG